MMDVRIQPAGDSGWLIELPERIDAGVNERAIDIAHAIERAALPVTDIVVGYRTVMVFVDPLDPQVSGIDARLRAIAAAPPSGTPAAGAIVDVPVCYDGAYGPDLGDVAAFGRCSPDDVIALHLARQYRVFMVGFVPGFAYLAPVDPRIAAPRRSSPRLKVPPGSVAEAWSVTLAPALTVWS